MWKSREARNSGPHNRLRATEDNFCSSGYPPNCRDRYVQHKQHRPPPGARRGEDGRLIRCRRIRDSRHQGTGRNDFHERQMRTHEESMARKFTVWPGPNLRVNHWQASHSTPLRRASRLQACFSASEYSRAESSLVIRFSLFELMVAFSIFEAPVVRR